MRRGGTDPPGLSRCATHPKEDPREASEADKVPWAGLRGANACGDFGAPRRAGGRAQGNPEALG